MYKIRPLYNHGGYLHTTREGRLDALGGSKVIEGVEDAAELMNHSNRINRSQAQGRESDKLRNDQENQSALSMDDHNRRVPNDLCIK